MKEEIVRELLKRGHLISPGALKRTNPDNLDELAQQNNLVLLEKQPTTTLSVNVEKQEEKRLLTPQDFLEYYTKKYETIRELLLRKTDALSVNKAAKSQSPITTIGMVRETLPNGFVLDDPTGDITVLSQETFETGDVVAVSGVVREGKLFAEQTTLPDIPLTNAINRIENTNLFLACSQDAPLNPRPHDVVVSKTPTKHRISISEFPNPAWITISGTGRVRLLVYEPGNDITKQGALLFLKKRYITPGTPTITRTRDPFLLEPPPDILWLISGSQWTESYKGVTIVSCREAAARINLNTRDVEFL